MRMPRNQRMTHAWGNTTPAWQHHGCFRLLHAAPARTTVAQLEVQQQQPGMQHAVAVIGPDDEGGNIRGTMLPKKADARERAADNDAPQQRAPWPVQG